MPAMTVSSHPQQLCDRQRFREARKYRSQSAANEMQCRRVMGEPLGSIDHNYWLLSGGNKDAEKLMRIGSEISLGVTAMGGGAAGMAGKAAGSAGKIAYDELTRPGRKAPPPAAPAPAKAPPSPPAAPKPAAPPPPLARGGPVLLGMGGGSHRAGRSAMLLQGSLTHEQYVAALKKRKKRGGAIEQKPLSAKLAAEERYQRMAKASQQAYEHVDKRQQSVAGWTYQKALSGDRHAVYSSPTGNSAILAYRGTATLADAVPDAQILLGKEGAGGQFRDALGTYDTVAKRYSSVEVTGHSKGGSQAAYVARNRGAMGFGFNPGSSLSSSQAVAWGTCKVTDAPYCKNYTSYSLSGDIVSTSQQIFPAGQSKTAPGTGGPLARHGIDQFTTLHEQDFN
eukprot:g427.t1